MKVNANGQSFIGLTTYRKQPEVVERLVAR
jgi:hypothetical protein